MTISQLVSKQYGTVAEALPISTTERRGVGKICKAVDSTSCCVVRKSIQTIIDLRILDCLSVTYPGNSGEAVLGLAITVEIFEKIVRIVNDSKESLRLCQDLICAVGVEIPGLAPHRALWEYSC